MIHSSQASYYFQEVEFLFLFSLIAVVFNAYAIHRRFYVIPLRSGQETYLKLKHVLGCFAIYLFSSMVLAPLLTFIWKEGFGLMHPESAYPLSLFGWAQLSTLLLNLVGLFWFSVWIDKQTVKRIWKQPSTSSIFSDVLIGMSTWLVSFPIVVVIGQLADMALYALFGLESYEQVAVRYLKMTLSSPSMLMIALFTILIAAPFVEEYLFRGLLQNYLKQKMGRKAAILLTSLCFALFHLAPSQGLGNISLIISLFTFACFLGFIYERQASLFASIGLHATFNTVSTLRILFAPDF